MSAVIGSTYALDDGDRRTVAKERVGRATPVLLIPKDTFWQEVPADENVTVAVFVVKFETEFRIWTCTELAAVADAQQTATDT